MATLTTANIRIELRPSSDYGEATTISDLLRTIMRESGVTLTHFHLDREELPDEPDEPGLSVDQLGGPIAAEPGAFAPAPTDDKPF